MRVEVTPHEAQVYPGQPILFTITIANTGTVIGGYVVRVLGADPSWLELEEDRLSLFPDESRTLTLTITAPRGLAAGQRRIAVQVRELTPPHNSTIDEIELQVPEASGVAARLDPLMVTAGKKATYSVLLENTGNTVMRARPAGEDPEGKITFRFEPEAVRLGPGEHAVVDCQLKARRHLLGSPTVRTFNLFLDEAPSDAFFNDRAEAEPPPRRADEDIVSTGTFLQRAIVSRGSISIFGLLAAISVFAVVITVAMSRLVGQSAADRNLALQIAAAQNANHNAGSSALAGQVRSLTTAKPLQGVAVAVFTGSDTTTPVATTATDANGGYTFNNLAAGEYQIEYRGAGLLTTWYPAATSSADASKIRLGKSKLQNLADVRLGGVPAQISGTVTGDDVSGSTLFLETAPRSPGTGTQAERTTLLTPGVNTPSPDNLAVVQSVPIGSDGTFSVTNVPSPAEYTLVVVKPGYAQSRISIDVQAGETRNGVTMSLTKGDGSISGTVTNASSALGNVTISATSGQTAVDTVSLTGAGAGSFSLLQLPTPATYTLVASKPGYASQTLTVTLTAEQQLRGLTITLSGSSGTLSGLVSVTGADKSTSPGRGVAVTVSNGQLTVETETDSKKDPGGWKIGGLPIPDTYTVTFKRADLATQIVSVSLTGAGAITPGSQGAAIRPDGTILTSMTSATAIVSGTVRQPCPKTTCSGSNHCSDDKLGEATVTLDSGTTTYTVTTATVSPYCGQYRIDNIPPGTYTLTVSAGSGTTPEGRTVDLAAGDVLTSKQDPTLVDFKLKEPARLIGTLIDATNAGLCNWTVDLYLQAQYPTTRLATTTTPAPTGAADSCTGEFSFDDIPAGTYIVSVGPTAGNPVTTRTVVVKASETKSITIQVKQ